MVADLKLAVTGATGFVGGRLLLAARHSGHIVRAITRRPMPPRDGVEWVHGSLEDAAALDRLCEGTDAVIHVAGVINARDAAGFEAGNVAGTGAVLAAAGKAGIARFVHVSSLAAREPSLSHYGASKARAEALVAASPLATAIVRPPAIYGPGDRELLEMFKMAARGLVLLPPAGRLSLLHADDLARLLITLADPAAPTGLTEPDDGRAGGWSHDEFAFALGSAFGRRRVVTFSARPALLKLVARADRLLRGANAKLTPDRASYFCHPDWVADPAKAVPPDVWRPEIATAKGLAATADWYRAEGWL